MIAEGRFLQILKGCSRVNLLGVDMGFRYVGIASVFDAFGECRIEPEGTLDLKSDDLLRGFLKYTGNKHGIVVGYTKENMDLNSFILRKLKSIQVFLNLPIVLSNEEFSTQKAHELLFNLNPAYSRNKFLLDQTSACVILSKFINKTKDQFPEPINY